MYNQVQYVQQLTDHGCVGTDMITQGDKGIYQLQRQVVLGVI
jgi:hypothetical protein